jgi:predicted ATPase
MLSTLAVANYRSLRNLVVPLGALTVITGPNGSGKSSVYRALRLLADASQGRLIQSLAREGGLQSTLWAGPETISRGMKRGDHAVQGTRRKAPVNLKLGFAGEDFGYAVDLGLPEPRLYRDEAHSANLPTAFALDPEIKRECIWSGPFLRQAALLVDRRNAVVQVKGDDGQWRVISQHLASFDSMLAQLADPRNAPELFALRESIRSWRFYDHLRTDADAPARRPQVGTHTPVLDNEGADFAAALQTIREIGDAQALDDAVEDAFPGAAVAVESAQGRFEVRMAQPGLLRPLAAAELSDGTLRYLLWIAALLTPRPPQLLVLNEPETSLHPDLLPALARLIGHASQRSQVIVVSHAARLIAALEQQPSCQRVALEKEWGETKVAGLHELEAPAWHWPSR